MSLALLNPGVNSLPNNGKQPVLWVGFAKTSKLLPCLPVSFLNNRLRVLIVFDQPARKIICTVQVRQNNFFEMRLLFSHAQVSGPRILVTSVADDTVCLFIARNPLLPSQSLPLTSLKEKSESENYRETDGILILL